MNSSTSAFVARGNFTAGKSQTAPARSSLICKAEGVKPVMIGLAADSGCGKSTFMRRVTSVFGGEPTPPKGGNPDSNTLLSDLTTVVCLDDYHAQDRFGRKELGITALCPEAQNFGAWLMNR